MIIKQNKSEIKNKNFDAIIYHGPCSDGIGGLWCACHYKPITNRYACKAGFNPKGDYKNMNVIFIDICPNINYLLNLVKIANNIVILDHHKSSEKMIMDNLEILSDITNLYIEFDMKRSGCQMAWDYFFDNSPRPFFIDYIGDRDLWLWKLPNSKEINTGLFELGYIDSYELSKLTKLIDDPTKSIEELKLYGKIIEVNKIKEIEIAAHNAIEAELICNNTKYRVWLGGNINPVLKSDLGNLLCKKEFKDGKLPDFSACWQFDPKSDEWWISLRGIKDKSPDLSLIASNFGGGGHPLASGISIKYLKEIFIY